MEEKDLRPLCFWSAVLGALGLLDWVFHRKTPKWTLSHAWRDNGRLDHPLGEAGFYLTVGSILWWFVPHMVVPARLKRKACAVLVGSATGKR